MLHRNNYIFINGTSFEVEDDDLTFLITLAEQRLLEAEQLPNASEDVMDAFHTWYHDGWLILI
jgi:50S ribosomal protein L16 3-hydroxylase